jgi:hypothetical protein
MRIDWLESPEGLETWEPDVDHDAVVLRFEHPDLGQVVVVSCTEEEANMAVWELAEQYMRLGSETIEPPDPDDSEVVITKR